VEILFLQSSVVDAGWTSEDQRTSALVKEFEAFALLHNKLVSSVSTCTELGSS
jgi:hypothetical protein